MNCHACQHPLPPAAKFCTQCGTKQAVPCAACQQILTPDMRFCPHCGAARPVTGPLTPEPPRPAPPPPQAPRPAEAAGDRRVVTVLFTDVSGFTAMSEKLDPGEVTEIVNQFFAVLTEPIYRYGGVVDKYIGDAIMALFGAPIAHEDDPERAVRAAYEMQVAAARFAKDLQERTGIGLKVRIGINTGLVVAGAVGGMQKRDYTVMGETVNMAQRMESSAKPGKVLVTYETYRHASHAMEFLPLEPIMVKGKNEPVRVYEIVGPKAEATTRQELRHLIGRKAELKKLDDSFRRAADGVPQLVYLVGEAGIGKSQLSTTLVTGLDPALDVDAKRVRAVSYEQGTPYALLADFIRQWLGIKDQSASEAVVGALRSRVSAEHSVAPEDRPRTVDAISYLLGFDTGTGELAQLSPQQRRAMAFRAFNTLLLAESRRRPMLLNFEDLHWSDEASIEWLQSLADTLATKAFQHSRVLLLFQARSLEGSPLASWRSHLDTQTLVLKPLSDEESRELLATLLDVPDVFGEWPEALRRVGLQILSRAEGNPLFLRELVRSVADSGVLVRSDDGSWRATGSGEASLPTTVNGVLSSRLDRLAPELRSLLQVASVVGRSFQPQLVASVGRLDEIEGSLEELRRAEFLHHRSSGEWQFHQALIHEVVYNSQLLATRRDLHRRVGETLERQMIERGEELPQVLARHYMLGEVPPKALYYLFRSGEMAHRNFSNQEAINCFVECLRLLDRGGNLPPKPRRDEILVNLADLESTVGQYGQALQHLDEALQVQTDMAGRAETMRRMGGVRNLQGQYKEAMERYEAGIALLEGHEEPLIRARILLDQGLSLFRQGQYGEVIGLCTESLSSLEGTDHLKEIAMAQSILGIVTYRLNQLSEAEAYHQRAMELREQIHDVFGVASSLNNLGVLYLDEGEWAKATDHYTRSLKIYQQVGDLSRQIIQMNNLGDLLRNQGDLEQAERYHRQALEISQQIQDSHGEAIALAGLGMALLAANRPGEAIEPLVAGIALMKRINAVEVLPEPQAAIARAYKQLNRDVEARQCLETALQQARENQDNSQIGLVLYTDALIKERSDELEAARQSVEMAVSTLADGGAQIELGRAYAVHAKILQRLGESKEAIAREADARAIFTHLGATTDLKALETQAAVYIKH